MTVAVRCQDCEFCDITRMDGDKVRCKRYSCYVKSSSKCPSYSSAELRALHIDYVRKALNIE